MIKFGDKSRWGRIAVLLAAGALAASATYANESGEADFWWSPGSGETFPAQLDYPNDLGTLRLVLDGGPMETAGHPFFEPLGPNGRACITCHQPRDGMSLTPATARAQWDATGGQDPLFAAYDGSNCPTMPQGERDSHSLLLDYGLFRIQRAWPPVDLHTGEQVEPDFEIEVVRDPWGCNTGEHYGLDAENPSISVYRRPRPVANLRYVMTSTFNMDPKTGMPYLNDPETGEPIPGNLMADARTGTLRWQMRDAARSHLEMLDELTEDQLQRIEEFERRIYVSQQTMHTGGNLAAAGAQGGPEPMVHFEAGLLGTLGKPLWSEFDAWREPDPNATPEELEFRASVVRGVDLFLHDTFLLTDTAGINHRLGFGSPYRVACVTCHNMEHMGLDAGAGQIAIGTNNSPFANQNPHLPLFRIRCTGRPHIDLGREFLTTDPGYALTTGRCQDVGKITAQTMRGMASRAPFFANGSAEDIGAVVDFYDRRYDIGYTEQERQDMINLLSAL